METLNFSGKSSSSDKGQQPWELLEEGKIVWADCTPEQQESIVRHFAPKVRFLALRLKTKLPKNVEMSELISSGTLGLIEALRRFEPQLEIRFETYAENRIRGAMLDELRKLDWFPRSLRQKIRQVDSVIQEYEHVYAKIPTEEEIQELTGLEMKDIRSALEALQGQWSVPLDIVQDTIANADDSSGEPFKANATQELVEKLASLIEELTPREKLVLSLYYGDEMNMRESAAILGITEGRVSQLHSQALARLRREFVKQYGDVAL